MSRDSRVRRFLARFWGSLGITAKLGLAFALMFAMLILTAAAGYGALAVIRNAEAAMLKGMEVQQRLADLDASYEKARRSYQAFISASPKIGYAKALELHRQPSLTAMARVIALSEELRRLLAAFSPGEGSRALAVDVNFSATAAKRFYKEFLEIDGLVTALADPENGLQQRQDRIADSLLAVSGVSPELSLICREMILLAKEYRISLQRPFMQSAFNTAFSLRKAVAASPDLDTPTRRTAIDMLGEYVAVGERIVETDTALTSKLNEFALQYASLDAVNVSLKAQVARQVEAEQARIDRAGRLATAAIAVAGLAALACLALTAHLVNASITRKIVAMTHSAEQLRAGNLDVRVEEGSADELGVLAGAFNAMAARVRHLVENLEDNVRLRTAELAAKNRELDEKNQMLRIVSLTDKLTGVGNRRLIDQALRAEHQRAKRYGTPYALLMLDLDHFKSVNDAFGHQAGDEVLVQLATSLASLVRQTDVLGRFGGEEFVILCPATELDTAAALAERIRAAVEGSSFPPAGGLTVSLGISAYAAGDEARAVLRRADAALYLAKRNGRNRVEVAPAQASVS